MTPTSDPKRAGASLVEASHVDLAAGGRAAILALNRPEQLNPLDWETVLELERALKAADGDESARAIFITGRGSAFSAGGDLNSYRSLQRDAEAFPRFLEDLHRTFFGISEMRTPVVALVNGPAVAGGLELMLSCDLAYAARSARISDGHLTFGQMGGGGVLTLLPRAVGPAKARELVLSGRWLSAEEAADWGLVADVVPDEDLLDTGLTFANAVAERSPLAVANAKYVMNAAWAEGTGVSAGLRLERERNAFYCLTSVDVQEGTAAFSEKRRPRFTGK
jgi:enoyl-CoA hydratase/carnithine racemase